MEWKPPPIKDHSLFGGEKVPRGHLTPDHPAYSRRDDPNVWGSLVGHHNPFHDHDMHHPDTSDQSSSWDHGHGEWDDHGQGEDLGPLHAKMVSHVKDAISRARPVIAIPKRPLLQVLSDGHVKNQHQSLSSKGHLDLTTREAIEHHNFGYPMDHDRAQEPDPIQYGSGALRGDNNEHRTDADVPGGQPAHARPIYGHLVGNPLVNGSAEQYGSHSIVLKKGRVWHRTSATLGDSLTNNAHAFASPAQDLSEHSIPRMAEEHALGGMINGNKHRQSDHERLAGSIRFWKTYHPDRRQNFYTEAQVHGGVNLHDIHYVVIRGGHGGSMGDQQKDLKEALNDHKIPWVHTEHHDSRMGSEPAIHDWAHHARRVDSYLESLGMGDTMGQVTATQGDGRFLIDHGDGYGQIADTKRGLIWDSQPIGSITGRGYWSPIPPADRPPASAVMALVKPA